MLTVPGYTYCRPQAVLTPCGALTAFYPRLPPCCVRFVSDGRATCARPLGFALAARSSRDTARSDVASARPPGRAGRGRAIGSPQFSGAVVGIVVVVPTELSSGSDVEVPSRLVVVVPGGAVPGSDVVVGGTEVVAVVGGADVVVVEVVVASVVVVVDGVTELPTVIGMETPNMPEELSVTSSTVVAGSTRVTSTEATPPVKVTLLPVVQSP